MLVQDQERVRTSTAPVVGPQRARSAAPLRLAPVRVPAPRPAPAQDGGAVRAPVRTPDFEVRLHAPIPQVVIVRVTGTVDQRSVALLSERVGQQLPRAAHVVLDLCDVESLRPVGVEMLAALNREANALGTTLHVAGTDHEAVSRPLRATGLDQRLTLTSSPDRLIALLRAGRTPQPAGTTCRRSGARPRR